MVLVMVMLMVLVMVLTGNEAVLGFYSSLGFSAAEVVTPGPFL